MPATLIKLRLLASLGMFFLCPRISPAQTNLPWTRANAPTNANWYSVALPSGGGPLVAAVYGGGIYTSTNWGDTWLKTSAPTNQNWFAVTASYDGNVMAAGIWAGGGIYISTNFGVTWKQSGAPGKYWASVASSAAAPPALRLAACR